MKVAITSTGNNLDSTGSQIFGRGSDLIFVEIEDGELKYTSHVESSKKRKSRGRD